jgi:TolB protein
VLDIYPYATTSPVYLELPGGPPPAPQDAAYFAAWMDRVISEAAGRSDYRTARERQATLDYLRRARDHYRSLMGPGKAAIQ